MPDVTVASAIRAAAAAFAQAGVASPMNDARLLMSYALNSPEGGDNDEVPRAASFSDVFLAGDEPSPNIYDDWARRRAHREPLQHIVGATNFFGYDFHCAPGAFIPRPETELLVEWALQQTIQDIELTDSSELTRGLHPGTITIVDLCSGPGTIGLSVAAGLASYLKNRREQPGQSDAVAWLRTVRIIGVEIDEVAIELAERNAAQFRRDGLLGSDVEISFIRGDVRDDKLLPRHGLVAEAQYVLANPPYVPDDGEVDRETIADPAHAVFSGTDGMELMPHVIRQAALAAAPHARIAVEHDDATGPHTCAELSALGPDQVLQGSIEQHQDLAGRDRFVTGTIQRDPGFVPQRP